MSPKAKSGSLLQQKKKKIGQKRSFPKGSREAATGAFVIERIGVSSATLSSTTLRGNAPMRVIEHRLNRGSQVSTISQRIDQVRDGLPLKELDELAGILGIARDQLAAILDITVRTLQRKAGANERLGASASDRLARVQRILDRATHVLGDQEKAARWLISASRPLGGVLPLQLLDTDLGTQRIEQELQEIEFGFPA